MTQSNVALDVLDRVYYMRAAAGVVAGLVAGLVIVPENAQTLGVTISILIAVVFYVISVGIGKGIATKDRVSKDQRKKVFTGGIFPFIFLLLTFLIITYTALHQCLAIPDLPVCRTAS